MRTVLDVTWSIIFRQGDDDCKETTRGVDPDAWVPHTEVLPPENESGPQAGRSAGIATPKTDPKRRRIKGKPTPSASSPRQRRDRSILIFKLDVPE